MLPDFIIIGVQRGGTTSLYQYIIKHPQVVPASQKELHFFDYNFNKGISWYQSQFIDDIKGDEHILTGEASPYYIFHPHAPKRISKIAPSVKIIVLLRNPVDRAYSHYCHEIRMEIEKLSFENAIKEERRRLEGEIEKMIHDETYHSFNHQNFSYLAREIYVDQLKVWNKFFAKDQILIICSEDFYTKPHTITNEVFDFLGISKHDLSVYKIFNHENHEPMNESTRKTLIEYFKPHNEKLYKFLNRNFGWNK